jgi:hypothetical protein
VQVVYFEQLLHHDLVLMEVLFFRSKYNFMYFILSQEPKMYKLIRCFLTLAVRIGACFGLIAKRFDDEGAIAGDIAR